MAHLVQSPRQHGYDDVEGTVVGGNYTAWCIAYDGRPQSQKQWTYGTDDDAIALGKAMIERKKAEYCGPPHYLYPDQAKWEVRIYLD